MTKTIIYTTMLVPKDKVKPCIYKNKNVYFPMNAVVDTLVSDSDEVKVIIIKNKADTVSDSQERCQLCEQECRESLKSINCNLSFYVVEAEFDGSAENLKKVYISLLEQFKEKSKIYLDMTFGPKYMPFVAFAGLNYSEKYYDSDIEGIYYGQVLRDDPTHGILNELSSIYRINSFCNNIKASKEAFMFMLKELFK